MIAEAVRDQFWRNASGNDWSEIDRYRLAGNRTERDALPPRKHPSRLSVGAHQRSSSPDPHD